MKGGQEEGGTLTNARIMVNDAKYFITSALHVVVRTDTPEHRR